jgi:acetyl esterase/lipase
MAERLQYSGVRCDLHLWDGQIHDFPLAADILPEGRRAIRYIGDFIREVTASAGRLPKSWDRGVTAAAG